MTRTLRSRTVYANRWMTVREDDLELADGSLGLYGVVHKRDFALVIPVDGDELVLVEQHRHPLGARSLEFPQGSWEDERPADPAALARAELEEETGLRAGELRHLGHLFQAPGYSDQGFDVFVATDLRPGAPRREASEADMEVHRVTRPEFEALVLDGRIGDSGSVAAYGLLALAEARDRASGRSG